MSVLNPISVNRLTFVLALFFVAVFNVPFFTIVKQGLENQAHVILCLWLLFPSS